MLLEQMTPTELAILLPILLMSLTVHEFAHARVALAMGDPTAKMLGRCTLNPLRHLSLFGTLALLLVGFGWAKPVPINPRNFRKPGTADMLVSFAGPASNFILGLIGVAICKIVLMSGNETLTNTQNIIFNVAFVTAIINFLLGTFNMIPLFPLDGHHILRELLPPNQRLGFMQWQVKYGQMVLLAMIFIPMFLRNMTSPIGIIFRLVGELLKFLIFGSAQG